MDKYTRKSPENNNPREEKPSQNSQNNQRSAENIKRSQLSDARMRDRRNAARQNFKKNPAAAKQAVSDVKSLAKAATPIGMLGLMTQINIFTDWMYGMAIFAAILKDLVDILVVGSLPVIGTVITLCISVFIFMMILFANITTGSKRGRMQQKMIRSYLVLLMGTGAEMIFGLNWFPIETITVLIIYALALADRKSRHA